MSFIRTKTVKGVNYYYLVESVREGGKVKQKILQYFGTTPPKDFVVPSKAITPVSTARLGDKVVLTRSVVAKEAIKKVGTTKTMGKVEPSVVPKPVSATPISEWDEAKRRLRGKHFAYVLKSFNTSTDSWARLAKWPERGDRVEIIKKMGISCLVEFQGHRFDAMVIHLSPEPPIGTTPPAPLSTTAPVVIPVENVGTTTIDEWDEAKRRLRGKHFAYVLKSFTKRDPWATGPAKRPDRGDRVEIIKKMGASCLVDFQGSRFDVLVIHLSPEPPLPVSTTPKGYPPKKGV